MTQFRLECARCFHIYHNLNNIEKCIRDKRSCIKRRGKKRERKKCVKINKIDGTKMCQIGANKYFGATRDGRCCCFSPFFFVWCAYIVPTDYHV